MTRAQFSTVAAITALLVAGCGGDGTGPAEPAVASISLSFPGSTLSMGATQPLTPEFRDAAGVLLGHVDSVSWSSSNSVIASVDQSGNVRGVSLGGPVTITVARMDQSASVTLTVIPDHFAFTPNVSTLALSGTLQLAAAPVDYFNVPITTGVPALAWATSNATVATVDSSGLVTARAVGDAVISVTAAGRTSGLHIEVGIPGVYDGTWTGTATCTACLAQTQYAVTITVVFDRVATYRMIAPPPAGTLCPIIGPSVTAAPNTAIANSQFSFTLTSPSVSISGSFTSLMTMTGNQSAMAFGVVSYSCSAGTGNFNVATGAGPLNLVKQ